MQAPKHPSLPPHRPHRQCASRLFPDGGPLALVPAARRGWRYHPGIGSYRVNPKGVPALLRARLRPGHRRGSPVTPTTRPAGLEQGTACEEPLRLGPAGSDGAAATLEGNRRREALRALANTRGCWSRGTRRGPRWAGHCEERGFSRTSLRGPRRRVAAPAARRLGHARRCCTTSCGADRPQRTVALRPCSPATAPEPSSPRAPRRGQPPAIRRATAPRGGGRAPDGDRTRSGRPRSVGD